MSKNEIFFGESGLTSTSANHIADLCKESYRSLEQELASLRFYSETLKLLGSNDSTTISVGLNSDAVESIPEKLERIADLKSLIAWLREAIKARKELVSEIAKKDVIEYCGIADIDVPECPEYPTLPDKPEREEYLDEEDYVSTLSIKERNAYFTLQTRCAVYGQAIHESGSYASARKAIHEALANPCTVKDCGRDTTILTRNPSVTPQTVEDVFFEMQAKHREYQAQLNALKHKCDEFLEQDKSKKDAEYAEALRKWEFECNSIMTDYNEKKRVYQARYLELEAELKQWKQAETLRVEALKIVIPDHLKAIYSEVNALGK